MLNYDDFIWNKYQIGAWLNVPDPSTRRSAVKNIFYPSKAGPSLRYSSENPESLDSLYQDTSIQALQHRGVQLLACHTATEEQARPLIAHNKLTQEPEEIVTMELFLVDQAGSTEDRSTPATHAGPKNLTGRPARRSGAIDHRRAAVRHGTCTCTGAPSSVPLADTITR
jgi:hypothetical protein